MTRGFSQHRRFVSRLALALLCLLLLACLLAACGSRGTADSARPPHLVTYTNAKYGFSVDHPSGYWQQVNVPSVMAQHRRLLFMIGWQGSKPLGNSPSVSVGVTRLVPASPSARELARRARRLCRQSLSFVGHALPGHADSRVDRVRLTVVDGKPAIRVDYSEPVTPHPGRNEEYIVLTRTRVFVLGVSWGIGVADPFPRNVASLLRVR
jgi:hypothetical protein